MKIKLGKKRAKQLIIEETRNFFENPPKEYTQELVSEINNKFKKLRELVWEQITTLNEEKDNKKEYGKYLVSLNEELDKLLAVLEDE